MEDASINEMLGPVLKWQQTTCTSVIDTIEKTEWTKVRYNGTIESEKLRKLPLCVSRASVHFETVRSHNSYVI